MTHPLVILTYIVGAGELVLAAYFLKTHSGATIRKVMSLLCASTGVWVLTSAFVAYRSSTPFVGFIENIVFFSGVMLLTTLVWLVFIYPYPNIRFDALHVTLLYVPVLLFTVILFSTKTILAGTIANSSNVGQTVPGPVYWIYNAYQLALYVVAIILLVAKSHRFSGYNKRNILVLLASVVLGGIPGVFLDLIAPFFNLYNVNFLYGNLASVFWLGGVTYILVTKVRR